MNKDTMQGSWKQLRGKAQEKWGKLTDDDLDRIEGKTEQLEGAIQKHYGLEKEKAREQVAEFKRACDC